MTTAQNTNWTHASVLNFAQGRDPVAVMIEAARTAVLKATDEGWSGPPFAPFSLAEHLGIPVVPCGDVHEARTVPEASGRLRIEFNPNRPKGRIWFSVAHELAHTFFPDCDQYVRHRLPPRKIAGDEWQLEMLCNLGAAELLMPIGSFPELEEKTLTVDHLLDLQKEYAVSCEAVFLRAVRLTRYPCAMFVASRSEFEDRIGHYHIDYSFSSRSTEVTIPKGYVITDGAAVSECTGIGFTSKRDERWPGFAQALHVECVGVPPYPGHRYARVVGLVSTKRTRETTPRITYVAGDATRPRDKSHRILAHVVNDKTPNWGGGFALVVRRKWPYVQEDFRAWVRSTQGKLSLGTVRLSDVDQGLSVLSMVSQRGYGPSANPRIRYTALESCLQQLSRIAAEQSSTVHMPRIGCGQAGGDWRIVSELIDCTLCRKGIKVTVYDPPGSAAAPFQQGGLFEDPL